MEKKLKTNEVRALANSTICLQKKCPTSRSFSQENEKVSRKSEGKLVKDIFKGPKTSLEQTRVWYNQFPGPLKFFLKFDAEMKKV